jgi:hypothetical protein
MQMLRLFFFIWLFLVNIFLLFLHLLCFGEFSPPINFFNWRLFFNLIVLLRRLSFVLIL